VRFYREAPTTRSGQEYHGAYMISMLDLFPEGEYAAHGPTPSPRTPRQAGRSRRCSISPMPARWSFSKARSLSAAGPDQGFKLELEVAIKEAGRAISYSSAATRPQIKGVVGTTDKALVVAGRSKEPPLQLAVHLAVVEPRSLSMHGLLAYEDFKWINLVRRGERLRAADDQGLGRAAATRVRKYPSDRARSEETRPLPSGCESRSNCVGTPAPVIAPLRQVRHGHACTGSPRRWPCSS